MPTSSFLDGSSLSATATGDNAGIRVPHNNSLLSTGRPGYGHFNRCELRQGGRHRRKRRRKRRRYLTGDSGEACGTVKIVSAAVTANRIGGGDGVNRHRLRGRRRHGRYGRRGNRTANAHRFGHHRGGNGGDTVYMYGGQGGLGGTLTVSGGAVTAGRVGGATAATANNFDSHTKRAGMAARWWSPAAS
jgi:hypothetical protein